MLTRRALHIVCCIVLIAAAQGGSVAAAGEEAAPEKVFKAAPSADPVPQNGTTNGEGNGKFYIKIGGTSSMASLQSVSDGTGNGNTGEGSGNNNGNRATGNGNNNAQITIVNDPAFLTCPPCQYYDPSTQLCVTVQSCVNSKPVSPASPAPPAGTISVGGSSVTAGRKMRL